jgi:hypothetical protein
MRRSAHPGTSDLRPLPGADLHLWPLPLRPPTRHRGARQSHSQENGTERAASRGLVMAG